MLAFLAHGIRREDHQFPAGWLSRQVVHDHLRGLAADRFATFRTVRNADVRIGQSQVIVDFRGRGDD
jgi:hypothetical protein